MINACTKFCGNRSNTRRCRPILQAAIRGVRVLFDDIQTGSLNFINFIDGNNDGNFSRFGIFDSLFRLRHDAVIGSNN